MTEETLIEFDGRILCGTCLENLTVICNCCGDRIWQSDDCYRKLQECAIKSYNYKPEPQFYGSGNLFYGVELEIDKGGERTDYAESILNTANINNQHLYAKHDSSIEDGFELVSHPMTLDYRTNQESVN